MSNKYHNEKVVIDGITFDSKLEGERYRQLKLAQDVGLIEGLCVHPSICLIPKFKHNGETIRATTYSADFKYIENGKEVWEDVKGVETDVFKLKKKWVWSLGYDLRILFREDVIGHGRPKSRGKASAKEKTIKRKGKATH